MSDITTEFAIEYIQETCEDCPEYKEGECISNSHCFEVKKMAIDSMRKVEKIKQLFKKASYVEDNKVYLYLYNADKKLEHIGEILDHE